MSIAVYTRRLVEHRYCRPLEDLRQDAARTATGDRVLPVVLRRLDGLANTATQARTARRDLLDTAGQRCRPGDHDLDDLLFLQTTEVRELERREQSEAEAVWDLLDVRLLLGHPTPPGHNRTNPLQARRRGAARRRPPSRRRPSLAQPRNLATRPARPRDSRRHDRLGPVLYRLRAERAPY